MALQHGRIVVMFVVGAVFLVAPCAFAQGSLEKVAVSLHDGWFVESSANTTATGAQISTPGFSPARWLKTSIPATPVGAQVENGIFPSPYVGNNFQQIPGWPAPGNNFANRDWPMGSPYGPADWWFLNQFTLPRTLAGQRIYLHFDGINYRANLWVNGMQIGNNTQMVGTYTAFEYDRPVEHRSGNCFHGPIGIGDDSWTVVVESAHGSFPETLNSPLRQRAMRVLPAVHATTTTNSVYFAFGDPAEARDAYAYFLYHQQLGH